MIHARAYSIATFAVIVAVLCSVLSTPADCFAAKKKKPAAKKPAKKPKSSSVSIIRKLPAAKTGKTLSANDQKRVERRKKYFQMLYAMPLESKDRFFRCIAIVGLNKVDAKETMTPILKTAMEDKDPIVRAFAFQAMLPRMKDLTNEQYSALIEKALEDCVRKSLRGELRVGLIQNLQCVSPDDFKGKARSGVFSVLQKCSHRNPADTRTLIAIRDLMAHWRDSALIKRCVASMSRDGVANKFEYVLGKLNPTIKPVGNVNRPASSWQTAKTAWAKWLKEADLKPKKKANRKKIDTWYMLPAPRQILDPNNPEWNEDLELSKLTVNQFDLVFTMDATGSMGGPMKWVAHNLGSLMNMLGLICREPRIGVTLFRHELDPSIQAKCCKTFKVNHKTRKSPVFGCSTLYPLSGSTGSMAKGLASFQPHSGNFLHPGGAAAGGLQQALQKQKWSTSKTAKKIIILIGDSNITPTTAPKSVQVACKIAAAAKKHGFIIHALRLKGTLPGYTKVAKAGGGQSLAAKLPSGFQASIPKPGFRPQFATCEKGQLIAPHSAKSPFATLATEVVKSMIAKDYHKRIQPLVDLLLPYALAS